MTNSSKPLWRHVHSNVFVGVVRCDGVLLLVWTNSPGDRTPMQESKRWTHRPTVDVPPKVARLRLSSYNQERKQ